VGFLKWLENNAEDLDTQLDLFGNSQKLRQHERVDGAIVNRDFNNAIQRAGGSNKAYARAVKAETPELFDCGIDELYDRTGGSQGNRSTLPKEAQKAYIVSETLATHRLNDRSYAGTQKQKDDAIVNDVKDTAKDVRKWLPW
jgi:hypothetical protein